MVLTLAPLGSIFTDAGRLHPDLAPEYSFASQSGNAHTSDTSPRCPGLFAAMPAPDGRSRFHFAIPKLLPRRPSAVTLGANTRDLARSTKESPDARATARLDHLTSG